MSLHEPDSPGDWLERHEERIRALLPTDQYIAPQVFHLTSLRLLAEIAIALRSIDASLEIRNQIEGDR